MRVVPKATIYACLHIPPTYFSLCADYPTFEPKTKGTGFPVALRRVALLGECQKRGMVCMMEQHITRDVLTANGRHLTKSRSIPIAPFQK